MRILIAGGTGFLGRSLVSRLHDRGHTVAVLTRHPNRAGEVKWDPADPHGRWTHVLEGANAVVSLIGERLDRRWTTSYKEALRDSRVGPTRALAMAINKTSDPPATFISGSAVGIYGARGDEVLTEDSSYGSGFLASLARDWEQAALEAGPSVRVVTLRSGVVLARTAGALPRMEPPFGLFVGGPVGSGQQYLPWIQVDDWTAVVEAALNNSAITGPLNATAPEPVTNREFSRTLGRVLHRPAIPVPAFVLKIMFGEMAETILNGQRVLPEKALAHGFAFKHPNIEDALRAIYQR